MESEHLGVKSHNMPDWEGPEWEGSEGVLIWKAMIGANGGSSYWELEILSE